MAGLTSAGDVDVDVDVEAVGRKAATQGDGPAEDLFAGLDLTD